MYNILGEPVNSRAIVHLRLSYLWILLKVFIWGYNIFDENLQNGLPFQVFKNWSLKMAHMIRAKIAHTMFLAKL